MVNITEHEVLNHLNICFWFVSLLYMLIIFVCTNFDH
jgi:hypothetical protein